LNPLLILAAVVAWLAGAVGFSVAGYNALLFALGRRTPLTEPSGASAEPELSVLIVAKSWHVFLEKTIRTVDAVDYPQKKVKIVLALGETRPQEVSVATTRTLQVFSPSQPLAKPALLNRSVDVLAGDYVLLLDEDSQVERDCLRRMVPLIDDLRTAAVVGLPYPTNASEGYLQASLWLEADAWATVARAKDSRGLFIPVTGFFSLVRLSALSDVGGWGEDMLAEDTELSLRLFVKGWRTRLSNARVGIEGPGSLRVLMRQRLRWYKGLLDALARDFRLVWRLPPAKRLDVYMTLLAPLAPAAFLVLLALTPAWPPALGTAVLVLVALQLFAAWSASARLPRGRLGVVLSSVPYAIIQGLVALGALGAFVLRISVPWQRTPKTEDEK
jgi:cellulose synthase/poly-beta-1,6-N-acetylglucosamine synthase-like glycosyltransferase